MNKEERAALKWFTIVKSEPWHVGIGRLLQISITSRNKNFNLGANFLAAQYHKMAPNENKCYPLLKTWKFIYRSAMIHKHFEMALSFPKPHINQLQRAQYITTKQNQAKPWADQSTIAHDYLSQISGFQSSSWISQACKLKNLLEDPWLKTWKFDRLWLLSLCKNSSSQLQTYSKVKMWLL